MTLAEGEAIAQQAEEFVLCYAVLILGPLHTTKVHELLAHLLEAMRFHGNIMNGDTSNNEQQHKEDKRHYARTNKSAAGFCGSWCATPKAPGRFCSGTGRLPRRRRRPLPPQKAAMRTWIATVMAARPMKSRA